MNNQYKSFYFDIILSKTKLGDKNIIYIGLTNKPSEYLLNEPSLIKNFSQGVLEYYIFPYDFIMKYEDASILETLLVCIIQYSYPNLKVYGGVYNRIDCDITLEKILEKFSDVYKFQYSSEFYKHYNKFINSFLDKNIKIGTHNLEFFMPVRTHDDGDIIMWNSNF